MNKEVLLQNQKSWDTMADTWFGTTALPVYGCLAPTEAQLKLFPDLGGKKVLDIGCGSGHSLKWCGDNGASELWGIDISAKQIQNADKYLAENSYKATLSVSPMEEMETLPKNYNGLRISDKILHSLSLGHQDLNQRSVTLCEKLIHQNSNQSWFWKCSVASAC